MAVVDNPKKVMVECFDDIYAPDLKFKVIEKEHSHCYDPGKTAADVEKEEQIKLFLAERVDL